MARVSGGDALRTKLDGIGKGLDKASVVQVGFMGDGREPDGTNTALVAAIQEYGAPKRNIPPRPFFRGMIAKESPSWGALAAEALKEADYDAHKALGKIGVAIAGELQAAIMEFVGVPLKPETVARKGFDKQLVSSGNMVKSVTSVVKDGGE